MKSRRTKRFRKYFGKLPSNVKKQAKDAYRLFKVDPYHPSLHFKCVYSEESLWSVRIGRQYRAIGIWENDTITWDFVGSHTDYDHFLDEL